MPSSAAKKSAEKTPDAAEAPAVPAVPVIIVCRNCHVQAASVSLRDRECVECGAALPE